MSLLARRYANALLLAAKAAGAVDQVGSDLKSLHGALLDRRVRALLQSPDLTSAERGRVLGRLGTGRHQLVQNTIGLLQRRRRLEVLFDLEPEYRALVMRERGEVEGVVESPRPLGEAELQKLQALAERLSGRRIALQVSIRPELIGGVRLRLGNVLYDGSVKTSLEQLEQSLLQAPIG